MQSNNGNCFEYGRCERTECVVCSATGIEKTQPEGALTLSLQTIMDEFAPNAFKLCQGYLEGAWKSISFDDFIFNRVSGGMSNYLYLCKLPDHIQPLNEEPKQVLVRLYGQIMDFNDRVYEGVIFSLLSERGYGPHLYGIFPNGRIEQYIPSRHLTVEELRDKSFSSAIAGQMAKYHSMSFPLNHEPNFLWDRMTQMLKNIDNFKYKEPKDIEILNQIKELFSMQEEATNLGKYLKNEESKVVFCHNDSQEGNILLLEDTQELKLQLIDFEYSSYNYREFDIGNQFCEYMYRYNIPGPLGFEHTNEGYPTHEQQVHFVRKYLNACFELGCVDASETTDDAVQRLVEQSNKFALASHMLWGIWSVMQSISSCIEFGYMEYGFLRLKDYHSMKKKLKLSF